ncbi:MAG TPA: PLDc N-terminal domain-containing protein [Luteolibacter sp.]|nr:PLDc N-terminal domain-containing protein [Luteolibacter sp.]
MTSLLIAEAISGGLGGPELVMIGLVLGIVGFWIWMLVDCATKENSNNRVLWLLVIALSGIVGAVIYFFARKLPRR